MSMNSSRGGWSGAFGPLLADSDRRQEEIGLTDVGVMNADAFGGRSRIAEGRRRARTAENADTFRQRRDPGDWRRYSELSSALLSMGNPHAACSIVKIMTVCNLGSIVFLIQTVFWWEDTAWLHHHLPMDNPAAAHSHGHGHDYDSCRDTWTGAIKMLFYGPPSFCWTSASKHSNSYNWDMVKGKIIWSWLLLQILVGGVKFILRLSTLYQCHRITLPPPRTQSSTTSTTPTTSSTMLQINSSSSLSSVLNNQPQQGTAQNSPGQLSGYDQLMQTPALVAAAEGESSTTSDNNHEEKQNEDGETHLTQLPASFERLSTPSSPETTPQTTNTTHLSPPSHTPATTSTPQAQPSPHSTPALSPLATMIHGPMFAMHTWVGRLSQVLIILGFLMFFLQSLQQQSLQSDWWFARVFATSTPMQASCHNGDAGLHHHFQQTAHSSAATKQSTTNNIDLIIQSTVLLDVCCSNLIIWFFRALLALGVVHFHVVQERRLASRQRMLLVEARKGLQVEEINSVLRRVIYQGDSTSSKDSAPPKDNVNKHKETREKDECWLEPEMKKPAFVPSLSTSSRSFDKGTTSLLSSAYPCSSHICSICLEKFRHKEPLQALPCDERHCFHEACIREWLGKCGTCPLCQANVRTWVDTLSSPEK